MTDKAQKKEEMTFKNPASVNDDNTVNAENLLDIAGIFSLIPSK